MTVLVLLGGLFGVVALTGGIQMLMTGQKVAHFSTSRIGSLYRSQSSFGPVTAILLGCGLVALCAFVILVPRKKKQRRN